MRSLQNAVSNLGPTEAIHYFSQRLRHRRAHKGDPYFLVSRLARYPLMCRAGTSDLDVFGQMFVQREYRCLDDLGTAALIIDCGANVGYSSAYFLSRFPASTLICVEPDPENFHALESNLAPYSGRVRAIQSAVWSQKAGLVISEEPFGDGREWARTVRAAKAGEKPTIAAVDIGSLITESGFDRVSILKIDIEGAEEQVFASTYQEWIDRVDTIVIELHGKRCESLFFSAVQGRGFAISRCDDLTICKRTSAN